jgi:hypothetical protein
MEAFLDWAEGAILQDALNCQNLSTVGLDGQHCAGFDCFTIKMNGAGAARRGVAANVRPGEIQILAQEMNQEQAWLDVRLDMFAIHRQ